MFSKALFKQSCKANGTMWIIISVALCFMLACVMVISGNGNITQTKDAIQDSIIVEEIDATIENRSITYYATTVDGLAKFDQLFVQYGTQFYNSDDQSQRDNFPALAYEQALLDMVDYLTQKVTDMGLDPESVEGLALMGSVAYIMNPPNADQTGIVGSGSMFDDFYNSIGETPPATYSVLDLSYAIVAGNAQQFIASEARQAYIQNRAQTYIPMFVAGNLTNPDNVQVILDELANFGVTQAKYDSFGYTYKNIKTTATNAVITFVARFSHEKQLLQQQVDAGSLTAEQMAETLNQTIQQLTVDIAQSLLSILPPIAAEALSELAEMDMYKLIVGSMFYKLAGLLLPIIYTIMVANNLIANQVDSGSMAYVLATSTKRRTVVFTQMVYLVLSLLAMFALTTVGGLVCFFTINSTVSITLTQLLMLNVGAFLVMFALAGLCFAASCWFDRSKHSMALGGGLSIFALVTAILGLFGSNVMPSLMRLDSLNYFNYVTVISLFDVTAIFANNLAYLWKFAILLGMGVVGFVVGSVKFVKKDLPL